MIDMSGWTGIFFWGFLLVYGVAMIIISPKAVSIGSFFRGESKSGKPASLFLLTMSIFISWIFAKSVTNAANLGSEYGLVGGVAYATYWLCIPLAGYAIYRLRTRFAATGLVSFLTKHYGIAAAFVFSLAILIRLFNEVWSNSSVVGGYYGESGSMYFIIAATVFTLVTLAYAMWGGLRSSIVTDAVQTVLFAVVLVGLAVWILPQHSFSDYVTTGVWSLDTGVDLLLVTVLQLFSYPFHDPVLTDRGFITEEKTMVKAFTVSGILGFLAILLFSFIGIHAQLTGLPLTSNVPAQVGAASSMAAFFAMAILMIFAAGSTLDSAFSSLAKLSARDLPGIIGRSLGKRARPLGMAVMVLFAFIGNLPMIVGTDILAATTISGTMIMGLGPIFLLHGRIKPTKLGFHLCFWIGIALGFAYSFAPGLVSGLALGAGKSATLLGVNLYGLITCTLAYVIPGLVAQALEKSRGIEPDWKGLSREEARNRLESETVDPVFQTDVIEPDFLGAAGESAGKESGS
ncbi:MAG: hypothetical protein LBJ48_02545 [Coriobacteriales bacterium]|jgi:Na+/proline symporter|nr:hypothetical protein [Coriobacteriales bacterium]